MKEKERYSQICIAQKAFYYLSSGKKHWVSLENLKNEFKKEGSMRSREKRLTHGEDYAVDLESNLFKLK